MLSRRGPAALPAVLPALLALLGHPSLARAEVRLDIEDAEVTAADIAGLQDLFPGVTFTDALNEQLRAPINDAMANLRAELIAEINDKLTKLNIPPWLRTMANAAAAASRGSGFDYATDPTFASVTGSAAGAVNHFKISELRKIGDYATLDTQDGELPERGLGAAASISVNVPLASLSLPRWRYFDPSRLSVGASAFRFGPRSFDKVSLRSSAWGLRASYRLLRPRAAVRGGLLRWGGLSLGVGVARAELDLGISGTLPDGSSELDVAADPQLPLRLQLAYNGSATLAVKSAMTVVPIELWTHAQLGYLVSLYAGGALDFNSGSTTVTSSGQQRSNVIALNSQDTSRSRSLVQPRVRLDADEVAAAQGVDLRGFAGLQLNLLAVAVFAQGSADTAGSLTAAGGARLFW